MKITGRLVESFTLDEMACKDGTLELTPDAVQHANMMQALRKWYNKPMVVNSWFRSLAYNRTLPDGTDGSKHIKCLATDIAYPKEFFGWSQARKREFITNFRKRWDAQCRTIKVGGGFGVYSWGMHFDSDLRNGTTLTTWDYSNYFK